MKKSLILLLVLLSSSLLSYSQEVQFPPAIISGGGSLAPTGPITITRWRMAEVHVLTISASIRAQDQITDENTLLTPEPGEWSARVYPNPASDRLKVDFLLNSPAEFSFEIADITGKKLLVADKRLFVTGQQAEFDLTKLNPGFYLLDIIATVPGRSRVFKISKY